MVMGAKHGIRRSPLPSLLSVWASPSAGAPGASVAGADPSCPLLSSDPASCDPAPAAAPSPPPSLPLLCKRRQDRNKAGITTVRCRACSQYRKHSSAAPHLLRTRGRRPHTGLLAQALGVQHRLGVVGDVQSPGELEPGGESGMSSDTNHDSRTITTWRGKPGMRWVRRESRGYVGKKRWVTTPYLVLIFLFSNVSKSNTMRLRWAMSTVGSLFKHTRMSISTFLAHTSQLARGRGRGRR
jgi:hypothetical protein